MRRRLHQLQRACLESRLSTVVVFEGWDAAGKGTAIRKLTQRLEPRAFSLHAIREPRTFERKLPWMCRFWTAVPSWGEMAIFDRSWYGRVLVERVEGLVDEGEWRRAYDDIIGFERTLTDDHYLVVKFFLHISKELQEERFRLLESDPETRWQVEEEDWRHHAQYEDYLVAAEEMIERTSTSFAPWTPIAAASRREVSAQVFGTLIDRIESELATRGFELPREIPSRKKRRR